MYGNLTVICGPMFAGKTTELLKRILWAQNGLGESVAVFKSAYDTRYKVADITSHDGLSAAAAVVDSWPGTPAAQHVFFDEAQFFTTPHFYGDVIAIIRTLLQAGTHVTATGLDADWRGEAFNIVAQLMAMADDVVKLRSHCARCGRPATKTYKRSQSGDAIQLGGADLYEPRCREHWSSDSSADLFSSQMATPGQAA